MISVHDVCSAPRVNELYKLFDSLQSLVQSDNVSAEIPAILATVLVGTVWLQLVGSSDA